MKIILSYYTDDKQFSEKKLIVQNINMHMVLSAYQIDPIQPSVIYNHNTQHSNEHSYQ